MKRFLLLCPVFVLVLQYANAQLSYSGNIDKYPVDFVIDIYGGNVSGIYHYASVHEPIILSGKFIKDTLVLYEKSNKRWTGLLKFPDFNSRAAKISGTWSDTKHTRNLAITLSKNFEIASEDNTTWDDRELIQSSSLKDCYFKVVLSKQEDVRVIGIKILDKKTNALVQEIKGLDCQYRGTECIGTGDFNFDGNKDFSVYQSGSAGPNTSSLYYLYNTSSHSYYNSGFEGTSLEFDGKKKLVYERNSCCAGTQVTTASYTISNNKMVLKARHCFKYDDKKKKLVERSWKDCQ